MTQSSIISLMVETPENFNPEKDRIEDRIIPTSWVMRLQAHLPCQPGEAENFLALYEDISDGSTYYAHVRRAPTEPPLIQDSTGYSLTLAAAAIGEFLESALVHNAQVRFV